MNYDKSKAGMLMIKVKTAQSTAPWAGGPERGAPAVALEAGLG